MITGSHEIIATIHSKASDDSRMRQVRSGVVVFEDGSAWAKTIGSEWKAVSDGKNIWNGRGTPSGET